MKTYIKTISTAAIMLFALFTVVFSALAFEPHFVVEEVKVNGVTAFPYDTSDRTGDSDKLAESQHIRVERGSTMFVEVFYHGLGGDESRYDTRIEVELDGYEYGVLDDNTEIFEVNPGQKGRKVLRIDVPEDIDSSDFYDLKVRMSDDDDEVTQVFKVRVEEQRHVVNIYDVIVQPYQHVEAGTPLFVTVTLENLGDNVEDLIKVTAAIPELGIQASDNVGELITWFDEDGDNIVYSKRDTVSSRDLVLFIPEDAEAKDYELVVQAEYNRGHSVAEKKYTISVTENEFTQTSVQSVLVSVSSLTQAVSTKDVAVFTLSLANMGARDAAYTFQVEGLDGFASYSVDPQTLTVVKDGKANVNVAVTASQEGSRTFTVKVLQNGQVLDTKTLSVNVAESSNSYEVLKTVLAWIFIVLLVVLVVLVIVLLVKRLSTEEETVEGKSFY